MIKININIIRKLFLGLMDIMLILLVLPFTFVMTHYMHLFFDGGNRLQLLRNLSDFSLKVSWVSCTFLFFVSLVIRVLIVHGKSWYSLFTVAFICGGLWIFTLNFIIESDFSFWRSLLPLTFCCTISTAYALGKALYRDDSWNFTDEPQLDFHEDECEMPADEEDRS
ncbi:MAG: hypothetical protein R6V06_01560 [Kiritimatiellia bacterium]